MSEKLSREEWKTKVLKVLETTSADRKPMTTEKVEDLRTKTYSHLSKSILQELSEIFKTQITTLLNSKGLTDSQRGLSFDDIRNQMDKIISEPTLHNLLLDMVKNNEIVLTGSGSNKRFTSIDFKEIAIENAKRMKVL